MGMKLVDRFKRATVALPLVAVVLLVSFGTGYRTSHVVQDDGSAMLAKGHTVANVNGETGRSDAEVAKDLATGRQRLEVVQTPSGEVYVVNNDSGTVTRIDTATMTASATRQNPGAAGKVEVLAGGSSTYVVDRGHGKVYQVDPKTLAPLRTVELPGGIDGAVVDGAGTCWVLDGHDGRVRSIVGGQSAGEVEVGAGQGMRLTLVGDHPVVVKPATGEVVRVDGERAAAAGRAPPASGDDVEVNAPAATGSTAWLAVAHTGELVGVDLGSGDPRTVRLRPPRPGAPPPRFGPPVAAGSRVYVPDYANHVVQVVDAGSMRSLPPVKAPGAGGGEFDLFLRNGKVWINDPYAQQGTVIGSDGHASPFDKGPGHGVVSNQPPPRSPGAPVPLPQHHAPVAAPGPAPGQPGQGQPAPAPAGPQPPPATAAPRLVGVPDVVGMDDQRACAELQRAGLTCRLVAEAPQPGAIPGEVVATDPPAGSRVRPGRLVAVHFFGKATVPDVTGHPVGEACALVANAGLTCRQQDRGAAPPGQPTGVAVAQQPAAGVSVLGGSAVTVELYGALSVPNVGGQPVDQACAALQQSGLVCQQAPGRANQPANVVYAQEPAAGAAAAPGSAVQVHFDPAGAVNLYRLKRLNTNVWDVTSDEQHYQDLKAGRSGYTYVDDVVLGHAYGPGGPGAPDLAPVYSIHCNLRDNHIGPIIYYANTPDPPPMPPVGGTCQLMSGLAAKLLAQPLPGTVPLQRMVKHHDGTVDYAYAVPRDIGYYQGQGFGASGAPLGWVWP